VTQVTKKMADKGNVHKRIPLRCFKSWVEIRIIYINQND